MAKVTKTIGSVPVWCGAYEPGRTYRKYNMVTLYDSSFYSKSDGNATAPAVKNGDGTITVNVEDWGLILDGTQLNTFNVRMDEIEHDFGSLGEFLETLAHSDCTLDQRVKTLEAFLLSVLSGQVVVPRLKVRDMEVWGENNLVFTGTSAPKFIPDRAGQFYIDTANDATYKSIGNKAVSDWKPL